MRPLPLCLLVLVVAVWAGCSQQPAPAGKAAWRPELAEKLIGTWQLDVTATEAQWKQVEKERDGKEEPEPVGNVVEKVYNETMLLTMAAKARYEFTGSELITHAFGTSDYLGYQVMSTPAENQVHLRFADNSEITYTFEPDGHVSVPYQKDPGKRTFLKKVTGDKEPAAPAENPES